MSDINRTRTFFIREETQLPTTLSIESEAFLPGWRVVKNLDRQALTREVEGANWNFFYLAGEIRATVLGRDLLSTLRRVVKRVLAKQEGQKFNSLEITKVVSKRFLGIPFMSVTAHSRHIQRDIGLVRESKDENFGFNAETGEFGDLVKAGVIDPAKVTRLALQNAASIAALMLTTEALVADIKDEGQKAAAGAGHGGGGMGGTY